MQLETEGIAATIRPGNPMINVKLDALPVRILW